MGTHTIPKLITFDGEARSGKGTIVQATKDYLREKCGLKPMLIDRGQTFRALVVAASKTGVNLDSPVEIDAFLENEQNIEACTQFVKDVYHMDKDTRDALLYTNQVGEDSAKIGGRPASQSFVVTLTKKWMQDAGSEGFDVVLLDGRALETISRQMHEENLCEYVLGLYFVCDAQVGARRTLGYAGLQYAELSSDQKLEVDDFVTKIHQRNDADMTREVERLVRPENAPLITLPIAPQPGSHMYVIDTTAEMTKSDMYEPVASFVAQSLKASE